MASFNNNFGGYPYGMPYQPYNNSPQPTQPNYNNIFQPQQPVQMNQYAFVNGIEGAKSFQMMPNQTIMLMDSENPVVYMKQSNSMGQSTLKYFRLVEINEQEVRDSSSSNLAQPNSNYVLKEDFEVFAKKVDDLYKKMEKPFKNENKGASKEDK